RGCAVAYDVAYGAGFFDNPLLDALPEHGDIECEILGSDDLERRIRKRNLAREHNVIEILAREHAGLYVRSRAQHDRVAHGEIGKYHDACLGIAAVDGIEAAGLVAGHHARRIDRDPAAVGLFRVGLDDIEGLHALDV